MAVSAHAQMARHTGLVTLPGPVSEDVAATCLLATEGMYSLALRDLASGVQILSGVPAARLVLPKYGESTKNLLGPHAPLIVCIACTRLSRKNSEASAKAITAW